jgi:hypothetical protein
MKKRLFSLILAAIIASMPLVACGSDNGTPQESDTSSSGNTNDTATADTEKSGVPSDLNLKGETINIWYTTKATSVAETFVDIAGELTGDILDDAIYNMNKAVEDKLNVILNFYNSEVPTSDTGTEVQKLLLADDTTYDLFHVVQWNAAKLAADGLYLNIKNAPYLSLDEPWWDGRYMKEMTIGEDALFALVGDYAVDRTRCLDCIYYNKDMYNDFYKDPNGLYNEVIAGTWTWDRLREISAIVWSDINTDGIAGIDDRLGYAINNYNNLDGLFYGTGARVTSRDKDDKPVLVMNNERVANICESLYALCFNTDGAYMYGGAYEDDVKFRTKFEEGTSMFLFGFFYTSEAMREMKSDFGIVPVPKYEKSQENYVSIVHDIMRIMVLPANCRKVDAVSAVLEELSFQGYKNVLPAYYNVLMKNKYARDDISATMLDIIRDNCSPDIAYIYGSPFNSLGYSYRYLIQAKSSNFASEYASRESAALVSMENFIKQFISVE